MRSPLLMLLRESGFEPTLDDWLSASDCDDTFDAELLDVVPDQFAEEYRERCRLYSEYEKRFAAKQVRERR